MFEWSRIFPPKQNNYQGSKLAYYFLFFFGIEETFRGSVHYFAPDGGSGILAGIPLDTYSEGAVMTIANHAGGFGIYHLISAAVVWIVLARYRERIPMIYLIYVVEKTLAFFLLQVKPLPVTPPGEIGVYLQLPIVIVLFFLSIKTKKTPEIE